MANAARYTSHLQPPYHGFSSKPPVMTLPSSFPSGPTPEKTVMSSSCQQVRSIYSKLVREEQKYKKVERPYAFDGLITADFFKFRLERIERSEIEKDFLALAFRIKKLRQVNARGFEFLEEKISGIASSIIDAITTDIDHHLTCCLTQETNVSRPLLMEEYYSLEKRVHQIASIEQIVGQSNSFPEGVSRLKDRISDLKYKLPDSPFVQGLKSFVGNIKGFLTPSPTKTFDKEKKELEDARFDRMLRVAGRSRENPSHSHNTFRAWTSPSISHGIGSAIQVYGTRIYTVPVWK